MDETPDLSPDPIWTPDARLRGRLQGGIWSLLASCAFSAAGAAIELSEGAGPGFTITHALEWAALLASWWAFAAYAAVGRDVGSKGLERSARCLFVAAVLFGVYELAGLNVLAPPAQVVAWIVFGIGVIGLLFLPFVGGGKPEPEPTVEAGPAPAGAKPAETEPEAGTSRGLVAGALGALAIGVFVVVKGLFKVLAKVALFRGLGRFVRNLGWDWAAVAGMTVGLIGGVSLLWFAVAKIRLRGRLGGVVALAGWAELLGVAAAVGVAALAAAELAAAAEQPGANPRQVAELEQTFDRQMTALGLAMEILWTALTVWVFASLRSRTDPDAGQPEWETQS